MKRIENALRWANALLVLITLTSYLSPYLDPGTFWPVSILGLFYPWLLLLNILCILSWAFLRKPYFWYSTGCLVVGWQFLTNFIGFHSPSSLPPPTESIRVLSYNCHALYPVDGPRGSWKIRDLSQMIKKYNPDVVLFQEYPILKRVADPLAQQLAKDCDLGYDFRSSRKSLALFSKYPIGKKEVKYFTNDANGFQYVDIKKDGQTIRVYNVHLQTNALSNIANQVAKEGNLQEKETWLQIRGMIGRYKRSAKLRGAQAKEIAESIDKSPNPVILGGDLNDVPFSYTFRQLAKPLQDAFHTKGRGLGITFNGSIPALRIDYLMAGPKLEILDHKILHDGHSDHYPVLSNFKIVQ